MGTTGRVAVRRRQGRDEDTRRSATPELGGHRHADDIDEEVFWSSCEELRNLRQFAQARRTTVGDVRRGSRACHVGHTAARLVCCRRSSGHTPA